MAKTKRRQLAALEAQAHLKDLADRIAACKGSGPPGLIPSKDKNPMVEVRKQRVLIKIPPLPLKSGDTALPSDTTKTRVPSKPKRRPLVDMDLEQVPADEAKISKILEDFGKWRRKMLKDSLHSEGKATTGVSNGDQKLSLATTTASSRHPNGHQKESKSRKRSRDLLPSVEKPTKLSNGHLQPAISKAAASAGLSNGHQHPSKKGKRIEDLSVEESPGLLNGVRELLLANATASAGLANGHQLPSVAIDMSATRVSNGLAQLTAAKATASAQPSNGHQQHSVAEALGSQRQSNRDSKRSLVAAPRSNSKARVKPVTGLRKRTLQEVVSGSTAGKERGPLEILMEAYKATVLVTLDHRSRNDLCSDTNQLSESARICNEDPARTSVPTSRRRSNRFFHEVPANPEGRVEFNRRLEMGDIDTREVDAVECFQKLKLLTDRVQDSKNIGKTKTNDSLLVSTGDRPMLNPVWNKTEAKQPNTHIISRLVARETEQLTRFGPFASSCLPTVTAFHSSRQTFGRVEPRESLKLPQQIEEGPVSIPFEQGIVNAKQKVVVTVNSTKGNCSGGKDTKFQAAELIKQEHQLAIMKKRLEAAGGLHKWLSDKGLGKFLPILEERKINDLSLLHLTMDGLKNMGLLPVGTRRKLIHAISCLTQPSVSRLLLVNPSRN